MRNAETMAEADILLIKDDERDYPGVLVYMILLDEKVIQFFIKIGKRRTENMFSRKL